jgi:Flp pilus assembly protein TadG
MGSKQSGRKRLRDERGTALVEFAIICLLFIGLAYAGISYGVIFWVKHTLTHAAAEGARAGVGGPVGGEIDTAKAKAEEVVDDSLGSRAAHVPTITPTVATCAGSSQNCITVTISYPYSSHPILPALPPFLPFLPDTLTSTSIVELSS